MLKFSLKPEEIVELLEKERVGHLATIGPDGPYVVPINYVFLNQKIYLHGRKAGGQKLDNIRADQRICFEVHGREDYRSGDSPCKTSTIYRSVIGLGQARILEDGDPAIQEALLGFARKFAPHIKDPAIPADKMALTAVIELSIDRWTGKYAN
jgi:nitroimidazol reductase NimA-like FMN-containing flavoprotein (pyridoxamine 5'-phosphate oxidase superfamily)